MIPTSTNWIAHVADFFDVVNPLVLALTGGLIAGVVFGLLSRVFGHK